jgi:hypothetical protein
MGGSENGSFCLHFIIPAASHIWPDSCKARHRVAMNVVLANLAIKKIVGYNLIMKIVKLFGALLLVCALSVAISAWPVTARIV